MASAPIRQPRGPPNETSFQPTPSPGPPIAEPNSNLRRNKSTSTTINRHQGSASISSSPATISAFHGQAHGQTPSLVGNSSSSSSSNAIGGSRLGNGARGFRSGSLSSGSELVIGAGGFGGAPGLSRHGSGREVRKEEVVLEVQEETGIENSYWGKGLSRQSSLPSRKGESCFRPCCHSSHHLTCRSQFPI